MPYAKRKAKSPRRRSAGVYRKRAVNRSGRRSTARRSVARPQTVRIELVHKAENPVAANPVLPIAPTVVEQKKGRARL